MSASTEAAHSDEVLQPATTIAAASALPYESGTTKREIADLRGALLVEWLNLPDMFETARVDIRNVSVSEKRADASARSWGLIPGSIAIYPSRAPKGTTADTCNTAIFDDPPAEAFAPLTPDNKDRHPMADEFNVVSTHRAFDEAIENGSFIIIFGDDRCCEIAKRPRGITPFRQSMDGEHKFMRTVLT